MRSRNCRTLIAAIVFALIGSSAHAWNNLGHKVVAEIAWRELSPEDRQQIVDTLRRHPRFDDDFVAKMEDDVQRGDKATQDHWIFQHAATWPDIARSLPKGEKEKYDRPAWHFVNLPLFLGGFDRRDFAKLHENTGTSYTTRDDPKEYNVLQALKYCQVTLAAKSGEDTKALAYCWIMHLVGDIHQPLHASALYSPQYPKGDRGGNSIKLVKGDNLHSLWDNLLGKSYYMRNVTKEVADLSDRTKYGAIWESAGKELEPKKWADESHELSESFVYDLAILNAVKASPAGSEVPQIELPRDYYTRAGELARKRVVAAGVRLGAALKLAVKQPLQ